MRVVFQEAGVAAYDIAKTREIFDMLFSMGEKEMKSIYRNGIYVYMKNLFKMIITKAAAGQHIDFLSR